jgi:hypothetical protein
MEWYHRSLHVRRLVGMAAVSIGLSLAGWWVFNLLTPQQDNPFKPLDLTLKPGLVTGFKLDSLKHDKPRLLCVARPDGHRLHAPRQAERHS